MSEKTKNIVIILLIWAFAGTLHLANTEIDEKDKVIADCQQSHEQR